MEANFNESYYATLAQVIPVFVVVMIAAEIWRPTDMSHLVRAMVNVSALAFAVFGEMAAITALKREDTPGFAGDALILGAVILPILRVCLPLIVDIIADFRSGAPEWLRPWLSPVFTVLILAVLVLFKVNEEAAYGLIAAVLILMWGAAGMISENELIRRRKVEAEEKSPPSKDNQT